MGRPSKGWTLRKRKGRPYSVRFTVDGEPGEYGTGTHDREEAARIAAQLYADAVRGARRKSRRTPRRGTPLTEVAEQWLTEVSSELDPATRGTYALYAETHWAQHWPTVEAITSGSAATYVRERLRSVSAATVRKEVSALRRFLAWCVEVGTAAPVDLPSVPKRAVGTKHKQARRGPPVEVTPQEIRKMLALLPVRGKSDYPIRARFTVAYETGLRSATLDRLSVPEHWRPGADVLDIPASLDKARHGRPVPLTPAARKALEQAHKRAGLLFPPADLRYTLRAAACKALGEERGERWTERYFRHARLTHWAETSDNLAGIMYLAGHTQPATTARYMKPSMRAALEVLRPKKSK